MYETYLSGASTSMVFNYILYVYNITNNTYTNLKFMNVEVKNIPEYTMLNTGGSCIFSLDNKHIVLATSMYSYKQSGTSFSNYFRTMAYCIYDIENDTYAKYDLYGFAMIHSQPIINNNYYCVNDSSQFSFAQKKKIDYIRNYLSNLAEVKSNLDWDNDLSNSSEDYFKTHSNDIEKDNKKMNIEIKKILSESYYSEEAYLNLISTLSYAKVKPDIDEIILLALFNETNWDFISGENFLFDEKFNLIGIYAVPFNSNPNLINMIVNVGYFKHEQEQ